MTYQTIEAVYSPQDNTITLPPGLVSYAHKTKVLVVFPLTKNARKKTPLSFEIDVSDEMSSLVEQNLITHPSHQALSITVDSLFGAKQGK